MNSIFDMSFTKIDNKGQFQVQQPQVGKRLNFKDRVIGDSSFDFNDHFLADQ